MRYDVSFRMGAATEATKAGQVKKKEKEVQSETFFKVGKFTPFIVRVKPGTPC